VSVLTVSWNSWRDLARCLSSVAASDFPVYETIVIDNGSIDGTPEQLPLNFPHVRLVVNRENVGHTRAINQGLGLVTGDYVLILDPDTELAPDMTGRLIGFLESRPNVAMVAPRTLNSDGTIQESARNFPTAMSGVFGRQSLMAAWFPRNPFTKRYLMRERLAETEPFQVEQISAACMMFRRELIMSAGPWDEGYFGYWVDTDWCMRVQEIGRTIYCVPEARIVHHENNRRDRKKSPERIWIFHQGAYRFYRKHRASGRMDPRAPAAFVLLALRAGAAICINWMRSPGTERPE
jgi:GT2 family glycosyltransferase